MKLPLRLAATLLVASVSHAATLPASEDTYGFRAKLTLAANKAATLSVDATHRAFVWFNLADLPPGATLRYARLRLYLPRVVRAGGGLSVHQVTGTWDESLASAEPTFTATPLANLPASGLGTKRFISVDVTATVQAWLAAPASNEGFAIAAIPGATAALTASVSLGAKEGAGSGYPAELDVEIADDPIAPGAVGSAQIAAGAVQSGNIASGAVGNNALADGSVTTPKLATGAVTDEKIISISGVKVSGTVANATAATSALSAITAANAITVNGIGTSATPTPNTLLPLDASGKFPGSVVSFGSGGGFDADLLDGLDSLAFAPATGSTAYVNKSGDTMSGNLTVNGTVSASSLTSTGDANMQGNILKNPVFGTLLYHPTLTDATPNQDGIAHLTTQNTASFNCRRGTGGGAGGSLFPIPLDRQGTFMSARIGWQEYTPAVGHSFYIVAGSGTGNAPPTEGIGFKGLSTGLKGVTLIGGVETLVDLATPLPASTFVNVLAIRRAASVEFFVNGVLKGTISSNLPAVAQNCYVLWIANDGTASTFATVSVGFLTIGIPMF